MAPGAQVEHPGSADLSRMMRSEASEVIESVEQGDGNAQPTMVPKRDHGGWGGEVSATASK